MEKQNKTIVILLLGIMIFIFPLYTTLAANSIANIYLPIVLRSLTSTPSETPSPPPTTQPPPPTTQPPPPTTQPHPPTTEPPPPTTEPPPPSTGNMVITTIYYDGSGTTEPDEFVEIKNNDVFAIQLANWTLRDNQNHVFTFPSFVIQPNQVCRVYTNQDHPEWCGFNYNSGTAIWNNTGDCGYLNDSAAALKSQYCYP